MNQVLIHLNKGALYHLKELGLKYQETEDELDVIVDDVEYKVIDGYYQDPDEQFCEHYGIDYDYVNCIEGV